MRLSHGNQAPHIIKEITLRSLPSPVDGIDFVRTLVRISYSLLVAQNLVTCIPERNALRSKYCRSSQFGQSIHFLSRKARQSSFQTVGQAEVIMAAHITNQLLRLYSPENRYGRFLVADQLRMYDSSRQPELHACSVSHTSDKKSSLGIVSPRATQAVAHLVTKHADVRELRSIFFLCQQTVRQLWCIGCPSFPIHADCRVNLIKCPTDGIHGFDVMNPHQVKTKTIYMIFPCPITDRLYHKTPHHRPFAGRFITTT